MSSFGSFLKITKLHSFGPIVLRRKSYVQLSMKNGLGCILGDFFPNSSGRPGRLVPIMRRVISSKGSGAITPLRGGFFMR
jgi:hypothetical protein